MMLVTPAHLVTEPGPKSDLDALSTTWLPAFAGMTNVVRARVGSGTLFTFETRHIVYTDDGCGSMTLPIIVPQKGKPRIAA
jgi:hypothetical protein